MKNVLDRFGAFFAWVQTLRPYRAFSRFTDVGGSVLSAGMSFQALFAVFASLWVIFGLLAFWAAGNEALLAAVTEMVNAYVPGLIEVDGVGIIPLQELLNRTGYTWASIVASASLIWVSITWFTGTRRAVRLIFGLEVKQYRNAVLLKIRDFVGALTFFLAILISAALTLVSSNFFSWLLERLGFDSQSWLVGWLGLTLRYLAMLVVDVLIIMGIHRYLAEVKVPLRPLLFGSIIGGVGLFALKLLPNFLLGGATSNPLLATFAVFVGLLLWFNLICRLLLLTSSWIATGLDKTLGLPEKSTGQAINLLD